MITVTGHRQFQAWAAKDMPPVEEVRPGVWSIPVPFPDNPMRYTLAYLLEGEGEAALVDPGWDSDEGWEALTWGLEAAGLALPDVTGVVVTHFHPDHMGMAARLVAASGAWLALGEHERLPRHWTGGAASFVAGDRAQFAAWGVPGQFMGEVTFRVPAWEAMSSVAEPGIRLVDGALLPIAGLQLRVLATPGHTPGHICLVDGARHLIFTGDHVLPRITPHISLEAFGRENPLADYLDSLAAMEVGFGMEVLPAHEYRFTGLAERTAELVAHTQRRAVEVRDVVATQNPATVWDVARELDWSRGFGSLRGFTLRLALAETASHLVYLRSQGTPMDIEVPRGAG